MPSHGPLFLIRLLLALLVGGVCAGCQSGRESPDPPPVGDRILCVVPGVAGDAGGYSGLKDELRASGATDLRELSWGAPGPLFFLNFQTTSIHDSAEADLARHIKDWLKQRPGCRVDLVGHSAGCGVILGALRKLDEDERVGQAILLSPSVSPGYDLTASLRHVNRRIDSFYSDRDIVFLKVRTGTFGTYDNVRTPAAGHLGFRPEPPLAPELAAKLVQHPYDPAWESLGNWGDHAGSATGNFVGAVVAPLFK